MNSPWINGSQGEYTGVPAGLAQLLAQRNQSNQDAAVNLGRAGGGLLAGIIGAVQAARNPQAFGGSTDIAPAPDSSGNLGPTGMSAKVNPNGGPSAIGRAMQGFAMNAGYATTGQGQNFKQFEAQGKMADATFNMLAAQTPAMGDQEPNVNGVTPTQWKHLGTADKISWFAGIKQANDVQQRQLGQQLTLAQIADAQAQAKERGMKAEEDTGLGAVMNNLPPKGSNPDGSFSLADYAQAMRGAKLSPRVQGTIAGKLLTPPKAPGDATTNMPQKTTIAGKDFVYNPKTGNFVQLNKAEDELLSTKPKPEEIQPGYIAQQSGKAWKIVKDPRQWEVSTRMDPENPLGTIKTERYIGGGPTPGGAPPAAAPTAPAANSYKTADDVKAAVKSGALSRADAVAILQKQFGYQ